MNSFIVVELKSVSRKIVWIVAQLVGNQSNEMLKKETIDKFQEFNLENWENRCSSLLIRLKNLISFYFKIP